MIGLFKARPILKWGVAALFLVMGLFVLMAFVVWPRVRTGRVPDFLRSPATNGYSALVEVSGNFYGDDPRQATNDYEVYLKRHEEDFRKVPGIVNGELEVPASSYDAENFPMNDPMHVRYGLALALTLKGRYQEENSRWREAAGSYLDMIRTGQLFEHGPLIYFLVGSAIEQGALKALEKVGLRLSSSELVEIAGVLQKLNSARIPFSEIVRRERYFMELNSPNLIKYTIERFSASTRKTIADSEERYLNTAAYMEIVATTFAVLGYGETEQKVPEAVAELVPKYLPAAPVDPYSKAPLVYVSRSTNFVVYSVGPNKVDDGGKGDDVTSERKDTLGMKIMTDALSRGLKE